MGVQAKVRPARTSDFGEHQEDQEEPSEESGHLDQAQPIRQEAQGGGQGENEDQVCQEVPEAHRCTEGSLEGVLQSHVCVSSYWLVWACAGTVQIRLCKINEASKRK